VYGIRRLVENAGEHVASVAETVGEALDQTLPIATLAVACLMVSRIRYSHVFNQLFTGKRSRGHLIQIVFTVAVIFIVRELAVPLIFCYFAFASPLRAAWQRVLLPRFRHSTPTESHG
jgi:CDP-diacylglycerol--serine O-phosphatidyltransferase